MRRGLGRLVERLGLRAVQRSGRRRHAAVRAPHAPRAAALQEAPRCRDLLPLAPSSPPSSSPRSMGVFLTSYCCLTLRAGTSRRRTAWRARSLTTRSSRCGTPVRFSSRPSFKRKLPREGKADEGFGRDDAGMEHVRWAPQLRVGSNDTGPPPAQPDTAPNTKGSTGLHRATGGPRKP